MVTGEPIPVEKVAHDQVIGATINQTGSFVMRAEKVGADTLLAQIAKMVNGSPPFQRSDQTSRSFTRNVLIDRGTC
jgi:Cu+-exporting ATPase